MSHSSISSSSLVRSRSIVTDITAHDKRSTDRALQRSVRHFSHYLIDPLAFICAEYLGCQYEIPKYRPSIWRDWNAYSLRRCDPALLEGDIEAVLYTLNSRISFLSIQPETIVLLAQENQNTALRWLVNFAFLGTRWHCTPNVSIDSVKSLVNIQWEPQVTDVRSELICYTLITVLRSTFHDHIINQALASAISTFYLTLRPSGFNLPPTLALNTSGGYYRCTNYPLLLICHHRMQKDNEKDDSDFKSVGLTRSTAKKILTVVPLRLDTKCHYSVPDCPHQYNQYM